jgi:hypothetical protein
VPAHEVVVAVHLQVFRVAEALRELAVRVLRGLELTRLVAHEGTRERFPDVAEQNDELEVVFEEIQKPQKLGVVVAEAIGGSASTEVQVRYDRNLHDCLAWLTTGPARRRFMLECN